MFSTIRAEYMTGFKSIVDMVYAPVKISECLNIILSLLLVSIKCFRLEVKSQEGQHIRVATFQVLKDLELQKVGVVLVSRAFFFVNRCWAVRNRYSWTEQQI